MNLWHLRNANVSFPYINKEFHNPLTNTKALMDPFQKLNRAIVSGLNVRVLLPWLLFTIAAAACIGIIVNQLLPAKNQKKGYVKDCEYGPWGPWVGCENGDCKATGVRVRNVLQQAQGGAPCNVLSLAQTESCATVLRCPDVDCIYSDWSTWSECKPQCFHNAGDCAALPESFRTRYVVRQELPGGEPCNWATLFETRTCNTLGPCVPDQACVVDNSNPSRDCDTCPDIGCTLTGNPYFVFCTRSILQSATGNGMPCQIDQLIYSATCPLPDCTDQCQGQNYDYFSRCSNPCGDGFALVSESCPIVSVTSCSLGTCPTGGMAFSNSGVTCSGDLLATCSGVFVECLSECYNNPRCNQLLSISGGILQLWSATDCTLPGPATAFGIDPAAPCLRQNWDMVGATCLYLCEGGFPSFTEERGLVFAFEAPNNGWSLSCPVTLEMASFTNACPYTGQSALGAGGGLYPYGLNNWDDTGFQRSFSADGSWTTLTCNASMNCEYQSWSAAPVWSQCDASCQEAPLGTRRRTRVVLNPATLLGEPCDPFELIEFAPCNQYSDITSASEMLCYQQGAVVFSSVSEAQCHIQCSESRALYGQNSCQSIGVVYYSNSVNAPEVFLWDLGAPLGSTSALAQVATLGAGYRIASLSELQAAYGAGANNCAIGWAQNDGYALSVDPPYLQTPVTYTQTQGACAALTAAPYPDIWLYTLSSQGTDTSNQSFYCSYSSLGPSGAFGTQGTASAACTAGYEAINSIVCSRSTEYACLEVGFSALEGQCLAQLNTGDPGTEYFLGSVLIQSNSALCNLPIGFTAQGAVPTSTASYAWVYGEKAGVAGALPFFTPLATSPFDSSYVFASQTYQDQVSCVLYRSRTDGLLNGKACVPQANSQTAGMTFSNQLDFPCDELQNCSLSNWVPAGQTCGICEGLQFEQQTRSIVEQAGEGGIPCSQYPQRQSVPCNKPPCNPSAQGACIPSVASITVPPCNPAAMEAVQVNTAFTEVWSAPYVQAAQATFEAYNVDTFIWTNMRLMSPSFPGGQFVNGSSTMPLGLSWMLNAQCLTANGTSPVCFPSYTGSGFDTTSAVYIAEMDLGLGELVGWSVAAQCPSPPGGGPPLTIDSTLQDCLNDKFLTGTSTLPTTGSYFWSITGSGDTGQWQVAPPCPYITTCCNWDSSCSACYDGKNPVNLSYTMYVPPRTDVSDGEYCPPFVYTAPCNNTPLPCPNPNTCPFGCDGSACNSASSLGQCVLSQSTFPFYYCSCSNGSTASNCEFDCGGQPGNQCSGNGFCNATQGTCSCFPGFFGDQCQSASNAAIGLMQQMTFISTYSMGVTTLLPNTTTTHNITYSQGLAMNDESNLYGSLNTATGADDSGYDFLQYFNPISEWFNTTIGENYTSYSDTLTLWGNMCVPVDDASFGNLTAYQDSLEAPGSVPPQVATSQSMFVPLSWMTGMPHSSSTLSTLTCADLPTKPAQTSYMAKYGTARMDVLAEFTSASVLPPQLWGKRFYTGCMHCNCYELTMSSAEGNTVQQYGIMPQDYVRDDGGTERIFNLIAGQTGYTLESWCQQQYTATTTGGALIACTGKDGAWCKLTFS